MLKTIFIFRIWTPTLYDQKISTLIYFFLETTGLSELHPVEMLQDQAQCILGDYVRNRYARQPTRFGRLLLAIPLLRMIRASTVETVSYFTLQKFGMCDEINCLEKGFKICHILCNTKTQSCFFSFNATLFFHLMDALVYAES